MSGARIAALAIAALVFALVAIGGFWLYTAIDEGVTATHQGIALDDHARALRQLRAVTPVAARPDATREDVIAAARASEPDSEPFEKEGFLWIDRIGLRFDDAGRLVEVRPGWE